MRILTRSRNSFICLLLCAFICVACNAQSIPPTETVPASALATATTPATAPPIVFPTVSNPAIQSDGGGGPRPPAYWMVWNSCAEDNRATEAAANGGREAGWILMDDLIANPGLEIGDYRIPICEAGLNLLQGRTVTGEESDDPIYDLASVLLTAMLNLDVGAESCPMAEEAVLGGHIVLSEAGFNGEGAYAESVSEEIANAIPRLVELLTVYNTGELCQ